MKSLESMFNMKEEKNKNLDYRIKEFYYDIDYFPEITQPKESIFLKLLAWGIGQ